jgi:hypothetical protein
MDARQSVTGKDITVTTFEVNDAGEASLFDKFKLVK